MYTILIRIMVHIPNFSLIDRIKTKTVLAGIRYFSYIGIMTMKYKIFGSKNNFSQISADKYADEKKIVENFHLLYIKKNKQTYDNTYWMGVRSLKSPLDLWIYQEILYQNKPDIIIETGTNEGGTALFLANICDLLHHGEIITIDIASITKKPLHNRIHYLQGDAVSDESILKIKELLDEINSNHNRKIMVILDDAHDEKHVLKEIEIYGKLVTKGQYLIVEDTSMGGHPAYPELGSGPFEAVQKYFQTHTDFEIDLSCEKFLFTLNPNGYLKKTA